MASETVDVVVPTLGQKTSLSTTIAALERQDDVGNIIVVATGDDADPAILSQVDQTARATLMRVPELLPAGAARNLGVQKTTTEYVAFCDDDDVWTDGFASQVTDAATSSQLAVGTLHLTNVNHECISVCPDRDDIRRKDLHIWNPGLTGSNMVISRDLFDRVGGWPDVLRRYNDVGLLIRLLNRGPIPVVRDATVLVDISSSQRIGKVLRQSAVSAEGLVEECTASDGPSALRHEARTQAARFRGDLGKHLATTPSDFPAAFRLGWYAARRRVPVGLLGKGCGRDHSSDFLLATS